MNGEMLWRRRVVESTILLPPIETSMAAKIFMQVPGNILEGYPNPYDLFAADQSLRAVEEVNF